MPHRNLDVCYGFRLSHRAHRILHASLGQNERAHREKQRWGVCFYINNSWCDERNIHSIKFCSPDLEFHMLLCRPFWLPREFTAIIFTAVYTPPPPPPQTNTDQTLKELYGNISEQETVHPDAAFVVTGDFNKANFRTIAPKYFQHITINSPGDHVLDHCYSPFRDAYKSLPRPPFGKLDQSSDQTAPLATALLEVSFPPSRTSTPGMHEESQEDHQGLQPPIPQTALSGALRETSPQHPILH